MSGRAKKRQARSLYLVLLIQRKKVLGWSELKWQEIVGTILRGDRRLWVRVQHVCMSRACNDGS